MTNSKNGKLIRLTDERWADKLKFEEGNGDKHQYVSPESRQSPRAPD